MLNRLSRRKRGMASNPLFIIHIRFFYIFPMNLAKLNWDSQLGKLFSLPTQRNFPIFFKPKVAITKFIGKIQKSLVCIIKSGLDAMPLFLLNNLLREHFLLLIFSKWGRGDGNCPFCPLPLFVSSALFIAICKAMPNLQNTVKFAKKTFVCMESTNKIFLHIFEEIHKF